MRLASVSVALLCCVACGEAPRTQIMLVVDAECGVLVRADELRVEVLVDGELAERETFPLTAGELPRRIALVPRGDDAGRTYEVRAQALSGSDDIISTAVRSGYVEEETRMLLVVLEDACLDAACDVGQVCTGGSCGDAPVRPASSLPPWESASAICSAPPLDGGIDAGPTDAGMDGGADGGPPDAGPRDAGTDAGVPVTALEVAVGAGHSCARMSDGTVWCWGRNGSRQVGDGSAVATQTTPQQATGLMDAVALGVGNNHSCAVRAGDTAVCWGSNVWGQIGNGDTMLVGGVDSPTAVGGLGSVDEITGGLFHTCAVGMDGIVSCWGRNNMGQLGDGTAGGFSTTPGAVTGIGTATAIALGATHACALLADQTVQCWGENLRGQLGDASGSDSAAPVVVSGLGDVVGIAAGTDHSCAVKSDGTVWCWGFNNEGQLGVGTSFGSENAPVRTMVISDAIAIAAGFDGTCAIRAGGTAQCWGSNRKGRLGTGAASARETTPSTISALAGVSSISIGDDHGCAVADPDGTLYCWGDNASGQLGTGGTPSSSTVPVAVEP